MRGYIYALYENNENKIFYIGSTINLKSRLRQHNSSHMDCDPDSPNYKCIIRKRTTFKYIIIDEIDFYFRKDLAKLEIYWIWQFRAWGFILQNGTTYRTNQYLWLHRLSILKKIESIK